MDRRWFVFSENVCVKTVYVQIIHNEMQKSKINRHFLCFFPLRNRGRGKRQKRKKGTETLWEKRIPLFYKENSFTIVAKCTKNNLICVDNNVKYLFAIALFCVFLEKMQEKLHYIIQVNSLQNLQNQWKEFLDIITCPILKYL